MNTKLIMAASALFLGSIGILLSFAPREIAEYLQIAEAGFILIQIMGALYFGFAILNWTAKGNIIGGIYSRPVAIGNFSHFFMASLALIKYLTSHPLAYGWALTLFYLLFALFFGYIFFFNPQVKPK